MLNIFKKIVFVALVALFHVYETWAAGYGLPQTGICYGVTVPECAVHLAIQMGLDVCVIVTRIHMRLVLVQDAIGPV